MKRLFEDNTICRLCLRVDERVYRLDNTVHKAFIASIIKLKQFQYVPPDDLYVCSICKAFLAKCFNFAQTLWRTQEIICDILKIADIITKPMVYGIDRHNKGLNPITLSSVVTYGNFKNDSSDDGHTSTEVEEVDLNILVNRLKKNKKRKKKCNIRKTENHVSPNSSSDENEETVTCNLDEEEVEISNIKTEDIDIESIDTLASILIEDAHDEPEPEEQTEKVIKEKRKYTKRLNPIEAKNASSTAKEKRSYKKSEEVDEDYHPDSTSHSEDSEYDSYDDEGKRIRRPKDKRVYPRKCDHCDFVLPEGRDHYRHYQYSHPDVEYPYTRERDATCSVCGKRFVRTLIAAHESTHSTKEWKCTLCPKVFANKLKWYRHQTAVHPKKTYTCDYCSKVFKTRRDIGRHIRTHTGSKPFKCHICGAAFAHSGNRLIHIRIWHQNYRYKPKKQEKTKQKRRKITRYSTDSEDDIPLQHISKTPSGDTNGRSKTKSTRKRSTKK